MNGRSHVSRFTNHTIYLPSSPHKVTTQKHYCNGYETHKMSILQYNEAVLRGQPVLERDAKSLTGLYKFPPFVVAVPGSEPTPPW